MADVEVSYKGSTIGSLSASGILTMETEGKYCEDDITLTYTSPGGGGSGLAFSTFTATAASTAATITFEAGNYTVPTQFALYLKSDVTAGDSTNIIIVGGWALRQSTIPVLAFTPGNGQRYYTYKASGSTEYYASAPTLTMTGTTLSLKFNNSHKFLSGSKYTLQIVELDSTFFS